jgi:hypothetical protein
MVFHFGQYWLFMKRMMTKPEKFSIYWKQFLRECDNFGYGSLGIVALVSVFTGAVITIQTFTISPIRLFQCIPWALLHGIQLFLNFLPPLFASFWQENRFKHHQ